MSPPTIKVGLMLDSLVAGGVLLLADAPQLYDGDAEQKPARAWWVYDVAGALAPSRVRLLWVIRHTTGAELSL